MFDIDYSNHTVARHPKPDSLAVLNKLDVGFSVEHEASSKTVGTMPGCVSQSVTNDKMLTPGPETFCHRG